MPTFRTMCPMNCHPTLCGMLVDVEDGRVEAVRGDPENPDSRGFLCIRGHAAREIIGNPQRLLHPLRRSPRSGTWQRTTWADAPDTIAARARAVGPSAVGARADARDRLGAALRCGVRRAPYRRLRRARRAPRRT